MTAVLDTNVLIRYLTRDNADHSRRALALLESVEAGALAVFLPQGVLLETVQVLSSKRLYDVERDVIRLRLGAILRLPGIQVGNKRVCLRALDVYVDNPRLSFVDALCVAHAQRTEDASVISFDRDFRDLAGLVWQEP